jgi:hypothetical protein
MAVDPAWVNEKGQGRLLALIFAQLPEADVYRGAGEIVIKI